MQLTSVPHHTVEASNDRADPKNLLRLRLKEYLISKFTDEGNMLYQGGFWSVVTVIGPYGDKHIMVVYTGLNRQVSNLEHTLKYEQKELFDLLDIVVAKFQETYKNQISDGSLELVGGINNCLFPGVGRTQSMHRPHFHLALLRTHEHEDNGVRTTIVKILDHESNNDNRHKMALNKQNLLLLRDFQGFLPWDLQRKYAPTMLLGEKQYAIDFELNSDTTWFSPENRSIILRLHGEGNRFLQAVYNGSNVVSNDTRQAIRQGSPHEQVGNPFRGTGFTLGVHEKGKKLFVRIKFSYKNKGEEGGALETLGHIIQRNNLETPRLPCMREIQELVKRSLTSHGV